MIRFLKTGKSEADRLAHKEIVDTVSMVHHQTVDDINSAQNQIRFFAEKQIALTLFTESRI